jgi:hypothetical protein
LARLRNSESDLLRVLGLRPPIPAVRLKRGRCPEHYRAYEREKSRARRAKYGTTAQRGYGRRHRHLRKAFARQVQTGLVKCARCGEPIAPGEPWDLGHDDSDRRRYSGAEHRYCNRSAAGRERSSPNIRGRGRRL